MNLIVTKQGGVLHFVSQWDSVIQWYHCIDEGNPMPKYVLEGVRDIVHDV